MAFGYYMSIDLYGCDEKFIDDIRNGYDFLIQIVDFLEMDRLGLPTIYRINHDDPNYADKAGLSGWCCLIQSGIQLHTITPKKFVSIDIYTCGKLNVDEATEFCKNFFRAERVETNYLERGKDYGEI